MRRIILFFTLCLTSVVSQAAAVTSTQTLIRSIYPTKDALVFETASYSHSSSVCGGGSRFRLNEENPDYSVQASALLMAFSTQKKVIIIFEGATEDCAPVVDRFWVLN